MRIFICMGFRFVLLIQIMYVFLFWSCKVERHHRHDYHQKIKQCQTWSVYTQRCFHSLYCVYRVYSTWSIGFWHFDTYYSGTTIIPYLFAPPTPKRLGSARKKVRSGHRKRRCVFFFVCVCVFWGEVKYKTALVYMIRVYTCLCFSYSMVVEMLLPRLPCEYQPLAVLVLWWCLYAHTYTQDGLDFYHTKRTVQHI